MPVFFIDMDCYTINELPHCCANYYSASARPPAKSGISSDAYPDNLPKYLLQLTALYL